MLEVLTANPAFYQLDPADLVPLTSATNLLVTAQAAVVNPEARSGALIQARNDAIDAYLVVARPMYNNIQSNPDITNENKLLAGVHVRSGGPVPIPVPTETPEMDILSVNGRVVKARVHTETDHRRRPTGSAGANIWTFVGEVPPDELSGWFFWGMSSKTTFQVDFGSSVEPGTKVWLAAGWVNAKGQIGPVCDPVSTHVQFGGLSAVTTQGMKKVA